MSDNVISLSRRQMFKSNGLTELLQSFASMRRDPNEVLWLKENAEILNILECSDIGERDFSIDVYQDLYGSIVERLTFFPQYYRFYLSIACDLEA